ncbi:19489_t:CDS:2 [Racocetra fulgida]|uniref:19489_t:CDS:1 n=1 Tax=Racocetra fulgida TaxID=60492 RepID=A0A9N9BRE1_9GLOM|nr:19489_t:CDS:2 [Racocetra fulgida]
MQTVIRYEEQENSESNITLEGLRFLRKLLKEYKHYSQDSYLQESYSQDSCLQESYSQDSYPQDSHSQDSYSQDSQDSTQDQYLDDSSFSYSQYSYF